jgi:transcription initiation factor IIE alpha subunit
VTLEKPMKKVFVKDKILNLMSDGRERTSSEIADRVAVKKNNVRTLLYMLKTDGKVTCETLHETMKAWRITEDGKVK